jgi:hypothetical protein
MSFHSLRIFVLLIFALSSCAYAQSLGEVARNARAERERNPTPRARVITNDDIANQEPAAEPAQISSKDEVKDQSKGPAQAASSADHANADAENLKSSTDDDKARSTKKHETEELEIQKRTKEINQQYLEQIVTLRAQINTAQQDLTKLQQDQVESTNQFRRTLGVSPNPYTYEQQQRFFMEQIEAQHKLINSLNSQLEDAQESARHAGVPHVYD